MQLVFLGTGGSWPSPERNVSSFAVKRGKEVILFDCGEGTQRQLMISSASFMQISKIFISHFHGDHFLGLPGLIQSMALNNRENELDIYGPEGTEALVEILMDLGYFTPTYPVSVRDVRHGDILEFEEYKVRVVDAEHNVPTLAYALEEHPRPGKFNKKQALELGIPEGPLFSQLQKGQTVEHDGETFTPDMVMGEARRGRKIVYSGDTKPCNNILELAKNADVLIHEATTAVDLEEKANEYGHSSSGQAAELAIKAKVGMLIMTHVSPRYDDASSLEEDAKAIFENSKVADDFYEYEVKYSE